MNPYLADFLWFSDTTFLYYALVIWLTLSILDVFFNTDYLNWLVLLSISIWATCKCNPSWEWGILIFFIFTIAIAAVHIVIRNYLHKLLMPLLNKNAPKEFSETMVNKTAIIMGEGENTCASVDGVLYPVAGECRGLFAEGEKVVLAELKDGLAVVKKA